MLRRPSVTGSIQLLPFHFPTLNDPKYCLYEKFRSVDFPIAIAFGDRDFVSSRGSSEIVSGSKQFQSGRSQLFKVENSTHFMQQDVPDEMERLMVGHFEGTVRGTFQVKPRGEIRLLPGKVPKKTDLEKLFLRVLCLFLLVVLLY